MLTQFDIASTKARFKKLLASAAAVTSWGSIVGSLSSQTDLQSALNAKQAALVSGTSIKTVNGTSLLGSGNLVVSAAYHHVSKTSSPATTAADILPVDVPGAVFDYEPNSTYFIRVMGRLNSTAATTGAGIHMNLSSAVTSINMQMIHPLAGSTLTGSFQITNDTSTGQSSGVPSGPIDVPVNVWGLLVTGANAGTAQLRIRAEVAAVTELMTGAVMIVEKVI